MDNILENSISYDESVMPHTDRIIEAYLGEYASGKSENAIARAVSLAAQGRRVTLVDLDLAEPCYTLRPLIKPLAELGVEVIAWKTKQLAGIGETGQLLHPAARWALMREGDIIFDIGYDSHGTQFLDLLENPDGAAVRIILVANHSRPLTDTAEKLINYVIAVEGVTALLANTHMAEETSVELVLDGLVKTAAVAEKLGLPIDALSVSAEFMEKHSDFTIPAEINNDIELRVLRRLMPQGFW